MKTQHQIVAGWLSDLAGLCAGAQIPMADAKARLAAYTSLLAEDFSPTMFCRESLAYVARQCKFFPSYGEVSGYLSQWWKEGRYSGYVPLPSPPAPALPPPAKEPPTEAELAAVAQMVREFKEWCSEQKLAGKSDAPHLRPGAKHLTTAQLAIAYQQAKCRNPRENMNRKDQ
jgi:hypothetical protein